MKPKIICHMMSSVDGRLFPERYTLPFDGKDLFDVVGRYFEVSYKLNGDAVIMGRSTLQKYFISGIFENKNYTAAINPITFIGDRSSEKNMIVIDSSGKTSYKDKNGVEDNIIAVLSEKVSDQYLSHLQKHGVSYVFAGEKGDDIAKAMEVLAAEFGLKNIILEGGGIINGIFLKAGLIDELSLMIYPGIDGLSGTPSIFEYIGNEGEKPAHGQSLEHISTELLPDGIVWIRYNFDKKLDK
ncbi:dihydrofolate reductase family protein [Flavobacterium sp. DGU38]|uniref:Dihydrofolate reductase family protein n=1 Tax=Flavobacterium calami TaxID=3139144 RepID=A0ABU9INW4_9FLAO